MISTYTLSMTTQPVPEANMVPHRSGGKRTSEELGELERATPNKRLRGERHISWAENQNETHLLPNNSKLFKEYRDENIWFTVSPEFDEPRVPIPGNQISQAFLDNGRGTTINPF
jgi:hypothetical protein